LSISLAIYLTILLRFFQDLYSALIFANE